MSLRGGYRATLFRSAPYEGIELFADGRIHRWWLKRRERVAPHRCRAHGRGLRTILAPRAEVAPVGDERRVESIPVACHGVSRCKEMAARPHFGDGIEADFIGRHREGLKKLREHLQHLHIENELL